MNRIRKIAIVLTATAVIAACGSGTEAETAGKKKGCSSSHACTEPRVKANCKVDPTGCELVGVVTEGGSTGSSGSGSGTGGSSNGGGTVDPFKKVLTVPKVVDTQADAAIRLLEALGLHSTVTPRYVTRSGDAGKVVAQDPAPFTTVDRGTTVGLTVTTFDSSKLRVIPDLAGKSEQDAKSALANLGLAASVTYVRTLDVRGQGARSSDPTKGTTVLVGSTVTVVVAVWSQPVAIALATVPNIVGLDSGNSSTSSKLAAEGLKLHVNSVTNPNVLLDGLCFQQSPAAGTRIPVGSTVTCDAWYRF